MHLADIHAMADNKYKATEYDLYKFWKDYAVQMREDTSIPPRVELHTYFVRYPDYMHRLVPHLVRNDFTRMQWCYSNIGDGAKANEIYYRHRLFNMDGAFGKLVMKMRYYVGDIEDIVETCGHEYPDEDPETRDRMYAIKDKIIECCSSELEACIEEAYAEFMHWRRALWGNGRLQAELEEHLGMSKSTS